MLKISTQLAKFYMKIATFWPLILVLCIIFNYLVNILIYMNWLFTGEEKFLFLVNILSNIKCIFENTNSILHLIVSFRFRRRNNKFVARCGIVARFFYKSAEHDSALGRKTGAGERNTVGEDKGRNILPGCRAVLRISVQTRASPCRATGEADKANPELDANFVRSPGIRDCIGELKR